MGILFRKPLTAADLNTALQPIKDDLQSIKVALLVPDGDSVAKKTTVQIRKKLQQGNTMSTIGHGLVLVDGDVDNAWSYYLISAVHVLVHFKPQENIFLYNYSKCVLTAQVNKFYLSPSYVEEGTDNIALVSLQQIVLSTTQNPPKTVNFHCKLPEVGEGAVAHGMAFLRGTVTMVQNEKNGNLFTVLAHSVPGSSGSPLFDNHKSLVGLVHGSLKHRGRHSHGNGQDASAAYCYSLAKCRLRPVAHWDMDTQLMLEWTEDVPLGLARGSDSLQDVCQSGEANDLKKLAKKLNFTIDRDAHLDGLMGELAQIIWKSQQELETFIILTSWKMASWLLNFVTELAVRAYCCFFLLRNCLRYNRVLALT